MSELIDILKKQSFGSNIPISEPKLALANVKLKKASLPQIPEDFAEVLRNFNGLSNEGSIVFGAETDSTLFSDLVKFNLMFFRGRAAKQLILGYDEEFYIVYDSEKKQYSIADRDTLEDERVSATPKDAIFFLMRVVIE